MMISMTIQSIMANNFTKMHQFYRNTNEPIQSREQTSIYRYFLLEKAQI
jgi:hypothetical protein